MNGFLTGGTDLIAYTHDNLVRMNSTVNNLGNFGRVYVGSSGRVDYTTHPNGMTADYDYFGATGDFRLKTIDSKPYPASSWAPSIWLNLGRSYYAAGRFSKAMASWKSAWEKSKDSKEADAVQVANSAVAEYAVMLARVGRVNELEEILKVASFRTFQGGTLTHLERAREGLWGMKNRPAASFACGPYALQTLQLAKGGEVPADFMGSVNSPPQGFSLAELKRMAAEKFGVTMQVAKRTPGSALILPAVAHWKVGHHGALVREQEGAVFLKDPTFGNDTWMKAAAIDEESSGYFLVPGGQLPPGWSVVADEEAATIYGRGDSTASNNDETTTCSNQNGGSGEGCGMAAYSFHSLLASLRIYYTPVGHAGAVGPAVKFQVSYNMREYEQC